MTIGGAGTQVGQASGLPATGKMPVPLRSGATCKNPRKNAKCTGGGDSIWFDLIGKNCYGEVMFPRRHRAGGTVHSPDHNLAEESKVSGPRLSCASRAVSAVQIGLILLFGGLGA